MKYMGSKSRIAKYILPIILKGRYPDQWYIEPFVGGANSIDKVEGKRIGADVNKYVIALLKSIALGWVPPIISKDSYNEIKANPRLFSDQVVGFAGIACSYSGKWFGGYAGITQTKDGVRDYQSEAALNLQKQKAGLIGVNFVYSGYADLEIPPRSIIYCDPPYQGTTSYKDSFDHVAFWHWCRLKRKEGHHVFVSEYAAPDDFIEVWSMKLKSSLSANGKSGGNKLSIEKLFTLP